MFIYIKSLKIYQLNIIKNIKGDYRKKLVKVFKIFLKKKKKKSKNMVVNITKISQKMKNKSLLGIGKKFKKDSTQKKAFNVFICTSNIV